MEQPPPPPPPLPGLGEKNGERESKTARKVTQNPRYFFPLKPNGNARYAGYNFPILDSRGSGGGRGGPRLSFILFKIVGARLFVFTISPGARFLFEE